jgi:S1-C subfamily serine protease
MDHREQYPHDQPPAWPYPTAPQPPAYWTAPPPPRKVRRRAARAGIAAAAVVLVGAGFGVGVVNRPSDAVAPAASQSQESTSGWTGGWGGWNGGWGGGRTGGGSGTSDTSTADATDAQQTGVVNIDVVLGGTQRAAGTGMVLTPAGEILTNRHVVDGVTSISVTVASTGKTYAARVVGRSTTTDVAVVQLVNASGLATVTTARDAAEVGDAVVGVGNAGGDGGRATAASGTVTGVDRSIVASDESGDDPERLTGLIETDAPIQPGDSGGPLLDASNAVVGMDTAGSAQGGDGYAVPIATALAVAKQIEAHGPGTEAGAGSSTGTQRAVLGVQVQDGADGVEVGGVVEGSPAAAAGLEAGDTILAVGGHRVPDVDALAAVMAGVTPGQRVAVTWADADGAQHSAQVTPVAAS